MNRLHVIAGAFNRPCSVLRAKIADEMVGERWRQLIKWGEQSHPDIFSDAQREVYRQAAISYKAENDRLGNPSWDFILLEEVFEALECEDPAEMRKELIQSMAVISAWIEDMDSRG